MVRHYRKRRGRSLLKPTLNRASGNGNRLGNSPDAPSPAPYSQGYSIFGCLRAAFSLFKRAFK